MINPQKKFKKIIYNIMIGLLNIRSTKKNVIIKGSAALDLTANSISLKPPYNPYISCCVHWHHLQ